MELGGGREGGGQAQAPGQAFVELGGGEGGRPRPLGRPLWAEGGVEGAGKLGR